VAQLNLAILLMAT